VKDNRKTFVVLLTILLALFVFRVLAQFVQALVRVDFLPAFDAWQSGAIPYPALLIGQIVIIGACLVAIRKISDPKHKPDPRAGKIFLALGAVYFFVMLLRLVAGFSFAAEHYWLGARLPAFFHLVLASFLLTLGFYHSNNRENIIARASYPVVIALALTTYSLCMLNQVNIFAATYIPVIAAAAMVTLLEIYFPAREAWQPSAIDVKTDLLFMVVVQMLFPRLLGFTVVIGISRLNLVDNESLLFLWPHDWPLAAQLLLMLLSTEFFRYWLHRLAHNWPFLWRFHAVHHSPHKLYWVNVGRFHPIEKLIQYLVDALPFLVLGVSEDVLAMYFVFYSINGFFQHCNIKLRLGFLNYIVSGPELHRWHHSKLTAESNNNYGNNLIFWDLVFGSWFLPRDRRVDELGLVNRSYPMDFTSQMFTPFSRGLDKAK
jgi:ornithine lipid hydroxylase